MIANIHDDSQVANFFKIVFSGASLNIKQESFILEAPEPAAP